MGYKRKFSFIGILFILSIYGCSNKDVQVLFERSKQLTPGDTVYLDSIPIGTVKDVKLDEATGKIQVFLMLDSEQGSMPGLNSQFIILPDPKSGRQSIHMRMTDTEPAPANYIFRGTDSLIAWKAGEIANQVFDFAESKLGISITKEFKEIASEIEKSSRQIDWKSLGHDFEEQIEQLILDFSDLGESLNSDDLKILKERAEQLRRQIHKEVEPELRDAKSNLLVLLMEAENRIKEFEKKLNE